MFSRNTGYTLIELIITIAICAILLGVAAPAMGTLKARTATQSTQNLLMASFAAARHHAVSQQTPTTVCPGTAEHGCRSDGIWNEGWIIFVDNNENGRLDATDTLLRSESALPTGLHASSGTGRPRASFRPSGSAGGSNLTLRICADGLPQGGVILSNTGRARAVSEGELASRGGCP